MKAFSIVLVRFPFTSLDAAKKRPGLVLNSIPFSAKIRLVTIAMITSQIEGLLIHGDVQLSDWKQAGLLHPSLVRLAKIATLEDHLVERELGTASKKDQLLLKKQFQFLFRTWQS